MDVQAGSRHSVFLTDSSVFSCGDAKSGQLGLSDQQTKGQDRIMEPLLIESLEKIQV